MHISQQTIAKLQMHQIPKNVDHFEPIDVPVNVDRFVHAAFFVAQSFWSQVNRSTSARHMVRNTTLESEICEKTIARAQVAAMVVQA